MKNMINELRRAVAEGQLITFEAIGDTWRVDAIESNGDVVSNLGEINQRTWSMSNVDLERLLDQVI